VSDSVMTREEDWTLPSNRGVRGNGVRAAARRVSVRVDEQ